MKKKLIWAFMIFCAIGFLGFILLCMCGIAMFLHEIDFFNADKWIGTKLTLGISGAVFLLVTSSFIRKA